MTNSNMPGTVEPNGSELSALHRLQEIERLIEKLVASWHRTESILQTRDWHRAEFEKPLALTPLDEITEKPIGDPMPASGRNVSVHGISFSHLDSSVCRAGVAHVASKRSSPMYFSGRTSNGKGSGPYQLQKFVYNDQFK